MWLIIEDLGSVPVQRIVAVAEVESAPIRRLLELIPPSQIIVLTGGRRRQSALILDSGHIVLTAWHVARVQAELQSIKAYSMRQENSHER